MSDHSTAIARRGHPVFVLGADCMTGMQAARLLSARGHEIVGFASDPGSPFCRSRAFARVVRCVDGRRIETEVGSRAWADALAAEAERRIDPPLLLPCTDATVRALDRHRVRLAEVARFGLPPSDALAALNDKTRSVELVRRAGVEAPRTFVIEGRSDIEDALPQMSYPCVLKPDRRTRAWLDVAKQKVLRFEDEGSLIDGVRSLPDATLPWILQAWIPGGDDCMHSVYALFDEASTPVAVMTAQKLRQWPPEIGNGSLAVEANRPDLEAATKRILQGVGHVGLATIQFKAPPDGRGPFFIEANVGRVALNMPIAEHCGVELLEAYLRERFAEPLPDSLSVTHPASKWMSIKTDLAAAFALWRQGRLGPLEWLRSVRGRRYYGDWSRRDPRPFLFDLVRKGPSGLRRALRAVGRDLRPRR